MQFASQILPASLMMDPMIESISCHAVFSRSLGTTHSVWDAYATQQQVNKLVTIVALLHFYDFDLSIVLGYRCYFDKSNIMTKVPCNKICVVLII